MLVVFSCLSSQWGVPWCVTLFLFTKDNDHFWMFRKWTWEFSCASQDQITKYQHYCQHSFAIHDPLNHSAHTNSCRKSVRKARYTLDLGRGSAQAWTLNKLTEVEQYWCSIKTIEVENKQSLSIFFFKMCKLILVQNMKYWLPTPFLGSYRSHMLQVIFQYFLTEKEIFFNRKVWEKLSILSVLLKAVY